MKRFIQASTPDSLEYFVSGCAYNESIGAFDVVGNNKATVLATIMFDIQGDK